MQEMLYGKLKNFSTKDYEQDGDYGDNLETETSEQGINNGVTLALVGGIWLLACLIVGFVLIYKCFNQMKKSTQVEEGEPDHPPSYSGFAIDADLPPQYSNFDNVVIENDPPSYDDATDTMKPVIT